MQVQQPAHVPSFKFPLPLLLPLLLLLYFVFRCGSWRSLVSCLWHTSLLPHTALRRRQHACGRYAAFAAKAVLCAWGIRCPGREQGTWHTHAVASETILSGWYIQGIVAGGPLLKHACSVYFVVCVLQMLPEDGVPNLPSTSTLLVPPAPLLKEENWPLLTISKGFFETLAAKGAAAAAAAGGGAAAAAAASAAAAAGGMELDENELEGAGWGDELDLGGEGGAEDGGIEGECYGFWSTVVHI